MNRLKEQEQIVKTTRADPEKKKRLEGIVNSRKEAFDEANSVALATQKKIDVIVKKIEEKTTGKTKSIDSKIKEVTNILKECKSEITKLNVGIKTARRYLLNIYLHFYNVI